MQKWKVTLDESISSTLGKNAGQYERALERFFKIKRGGGIVVPFHYSKGMGGEEIVSLGTNSKARIIIQQRIEEQVKRGQLFCQKPRKGFLPNFCKKKKWDRGGMRHPW